MPRNTSPLQNTKNKTAVKLTAVSCAPVVEVKIKRPDTKYQLGFSVQNGVVSTSVPEKRIHAFHAKTSPPLPLTPNPTDVSVTFYTGCGGARKQIARGELVGWSS